MGKAKRKAAQGGTTITPGREAARMAINHAIGGKFTIGDAMCGSIDALAQIVGASHDTISEADRCIDNIAADLRKAIRENWQEMTWARRLVCAKPEGRG